MWLMSKDGANQRPLTRGQQSKETAPHFLRDGSLVYLLEQKESGRTVTQVVKVDLPSGKATPLSGVDLVVADFTVSPAGDLRSEEHTSELQSRLHLVCRLLLEKKKK